MPAVLRLLTLTCLMALLASCARTSQVATRYLDDTPPHPLPRLMITARTPDQVMRSRWENACLAGAGDQAALFASHAELPLWYDAGNDQLLEWLQGQRPESGLLVFDITPLLIGPMQMPPENEVNQSRFPDGQNPRHNTWQIGFGDEAASPDLAADNQNIEVRLMLANGDVLWDGLILTREANDLDAIARSQCQAVMEQLRALGWLP